MALDNASGMEEVCDVIILTVVLRGGKESFVVSMAMGIVALLDVCPQLLLTVYVRHMEVVGDV
jgi:hypothetical protein